MIPENILITGIPRSGTTLVCSLLNQLPNTVALHEPMQVGSLVGLEDRAICHEISRFFRHSREAIGSQGVAFSKHISGSIPDNTFTDMRNHAGLRQNMDIKGVVNIHKELGDEFTLCLKHPAAFTAILEIISKSFRCYAVIRNPLAVLASWNSVDAPVRDGHSPIAEYLDSSLAQELGKINDRYDRQVHLINWYFAKYQEVLPRDSIIRYEDVVSTGGRCLNVITPDAEMLVERLENKNNNALYDRGCMQELGKRILGANGVCFDFYSQESVEALLQ